MKTFKRITIHNSCHLNSCAASFDHSKLTMLIPKTKVRSSAQGTYKYVKCRKCRHLLFCHPEVTLLTAHGESYSNVSVKYVSCSTIQEDNIWFLVDNNLPQWISDAINDSNWTKGKVNCPNCQGRLGSFDFVSGTQCQCGSHVLPPVRIIKCKVDCRNQR